MEATLITNCGSKLMKVVAGIWTGAEECLWNYRTEWYEVYFDETISYATLHKGRECYEKNLPLLKRILAFMVHSGSTVAETYNWFSNQLRMTPYWFGQRNLLLGLIYCCEYYMQTAIETNLDLLSQDDIMEEYRWELDSNDLSEIIRLFRTKN